jgi:exopolyphosphatase/guanosine-5'-triphosphate,3'-diphosphate pyrophosphatase
MTRVAVVDCGTNSIRLLIAERGPDGGLVELERRTEIVRLGQGVDATGEFHPDALTRTFVATEAYAALVRDAGVPPEHVRFVATSASRDARNREEFFAGIRRRLGVTPEVVSGDTEAELSFAGALSRIGEVAEPVLVVDIGGGSTELVLGDDEPDSGVSIDIGAVRLHERHLHDDPPTGEQVAACVADIDAHLDACPVQLADARTAVGTSGTIKTLAAGLLDLSTYDRDAIDGARLRTADTVDFTDRLVSMSVAQRRALPYLHPGRADVIAAGALIWSRVLIRAGVAGYVVSEADILYGIAWSLADGP